MEEKEKSRELDALKSQELSGAVGGVARGQHGYEGQPGNQGNGQKGYEGQPGNQGCC